MKIHHTLLAALGCLCVLTSALHAQVPNLVSNQGRVAVNGVNFDGPGYFKFALVDGAGTTTYWTNDGNNPTVNPVTLTVKNGLYSVLLGDVTLTKAIPLNVWENPDVRLRVWFSDGSPEFQLLTPDQRVAPNGYLPDGAVTSATLADGAVSATKLSDGAVTSAKIATDAVGAANIAAGAVDGTKIANGSIATTNLADGSVTAAKLDATGIGLWSANGANVFRSGGNVGIGATTPAGKLEIDASIYDGNSLYLRHPGVSWGTTSLFESYRFITTTSGALDGAFKQFNVGAGGMSIGYSAVPPYASSDALYVSGNVGIGTTGPYARLHVGPSLNGVYPGVASPFAIVNGGSLGGTLNDDLTLSQFVFAPAGANQASFGIHARKTAAGTGWSATSLGLAFDVDATPSAGGAIWFHVGNVGIGTTNPTSKLDVAGDVAVAGDLKMTATTPTSGAIRVGGSTLLHSFGTQNLFVGLGAGNRTMTGSNNTASGASALASNTAASRNVAIGAEALFAQSFANGGAAYDSNNVAVGYQALRSNQPQNVSDIAQGINNTAIGTQALYANSSGAENTALGNEALQANSTGFNNTASGASALASNTTGFWNTASGYGALYANTVGTSNTASGYQALNTNTVGYLNTATGVSALRGNQTGNANTATGSGALLYNTTGNNNTAIGGAALQNHTAGSNNIAVGYAAGINHNDGDNNIYIGGFAAYTESNTIRIGENTRPTSTFIAGINGATAPSGVPVFVSGDGKLGTITSSRRFKQDIANMDGASDALLSLRPVTFRYKADIDPQGIPQFGLIAEEVDEIAPGLVVRDNKGEIQTVRYEAVNAMLLNEFLKEHRRVDAAVKTNAEQEKRLATQEETIKAQAQAIAEYEKRLATLESRDKAREARLTRLENAIDARAASTAPASLDRTRRAAVLTKGGAQ